MKSPLSVMALLLAGTLLATIDSGCRTNGTADPATSRCPICGRRTNTVPVSAITYNKTACVECRKVQTYDSPIYDALRQQFGTPPDQTESEVASVCKHCQVVVWKCPECRAKEQKP